MSSLPNNTFASPGNPFYAIVGAGSASTLQSPAAILPNPADGTVSLQLTTPTNGADCFINIGSTQSNCGGALNITNGNFASSALSLGINPVTLEVSNFTSTLKIVNDASSIDIAVFDTANNAITLGSGAVAAAGQTVVNTPLIIQDQDLSGTALSISGGLPFIGVNGVTSIKNTVATGGAILIGSSLATPTVLSVFDSLGGAAVSVGGNGVGLTDVIISGGITGGAANITTSASNTGQMTIGASATNSQTVFVRDGATANSGYVDITGGTSGTDALRLRGYQAGGAPTISTNRITGAAASITITPGSDDVTPCMVMSNDGAGNLNIDVGQQMNIAKMPFGQGSYVAQTLIPAGSSFASPFELDLTQLQSGYAMVFGYSTTPTVDRAFMFSVMVYTGATNILQGGGQGGVPGYSEVTPSATNPSALTVIFAATPSANYSIRGITLLGG